jgi:hypothetical protein
MRSNWRFKMATIRQNQKDGAPTCINDVIKLTVTPDGGFAVRLTNKTGSASVKGTIVSADTTTDNAFKVAAGDSVTPCAVVYEDGIADGSECYVVVAGIAEVLVSAGDATTHGDWMGVSATAGLAASSGGEGAGAAHDREIGHALESKGAGVNVKVVLHFR